MNIKSLNHNELLCMVQDIADLFSIGSKVRTQSVIMQNVTNSANDEFCGNKKEWISIDDDMPECDVEVLTWDGCDRGLDYCDIEVDYGTVYFANDEFKKITHWQSLNDTPPEVIE